MATKKKRLCVSITTENYALLKWLNLNYQDKYSWIVNNLLSKYHEAITSQMSDYEKEQISNLKVILDDSVFDKERIEKVRFEAFDLAFESRLLELIGNDDKRSKLRELLDLADKDD